jgi:integrase
VPGLRVSVTPRGAKSFILWRRVDPRAKSASALTLGRVGELMLADARTKARAWLAQIAAGQDPRATERTARDNTFAAVMETYLTTHVKHQRKFADVAREMRKELLPRFGHRPVATIARRDVIKMIDELKARAASQARNCFGHMRAFCNWAIAKDLLATSPCDHVQLTRLIGSKLPRQRVLTDAEIAAIWIATEQFGYPYGPLVRLLLLTGTRKNEAARARWCEFDLVNKTWTIPRERYKSDAEHVVPLADATLELLASLPRWANTNLVFSTNGRRPFTGFSSAKRALDAAMGDPAAFVIHDLRRTMRTRLSELKVPEHIAELAIGHAQRGLMRIYDRHRYADELRAAFAAWAARLQTIVCSSGRKIFDLAPPPTARILRLAHTN